MHRVGYCSKAMQNTVNGLSWFLGPAFVILWALPF